MAANSTEQTHNAENTRDVSNEVSCCYGCLRVLLKICLVTACLGVVLLLAGIISIMVFGGGEGRAILPGIASFIIMFSMLLYVVFEIKLAEMYSNRKAAGSDNGGLELTVEDAVWDISDILSVPVNTEVVQPRLDEAQPIAESLSPNPPRYEDVVPASSRARVRMPPPVQDGGELLSMEIVDHFEIPPSYEDATTGGKYNLGQE